MRNLLRRLPPLVVLVRAVRALLRPDYRRIWRLQRSNRNRLFQPYNLTWENRYPQIFAFLQHVLASRPRLRILSFGCSTGEEVFSLASHFPDAQIVGIDIDPANIAACQRALAARPSSLITFKQGADVDGEAPASFDLILCMAVLRHGELAAAKPDRCDPVLYFAQFERIIAGFERCLNPGGLLALWHCHFRLEDADAQGRFAPVMKLRAIIDEPVYGPDNRRKAAQSYEDAIFRKRPD